MSYSNDDQNLFRQIIADHHRNPRNKGLVDQEGYQRLHLKNPSCGDDLEIQLHLQNGVLQDIRHEGTGCAICCSSASIMSERLKGCEVNEAKAIICEFKQMVSAEPYNEELLEEAIVFQGVANLPPRIKCATLAWLACEAAIEQQETQA